MQSDQWQYVTKYLHAFENEQLPNDINEYPQIESKLESLGLVLE